MASSNGLNDINHEPLYNSKIINIYVEYLEDHYPDLDIESLLDFAGMTRY